MRIRKMIALSASALVLGLTVGTTSAAFASSQDEADTEGVFTGGQPAPLILTPAELAAGTVNLAPGQALVVVDGDDVWSGSGGSENADVASYTAASEVDDTTYNAGFTIGETGSTTAWIADNAGARTTFTVNIEAQ